MNTKKLIGTIIGVIAFAGLVVGATYAWLTVTANVNGAVYNGTSKRFVIDYSGGTEVTELKQIASGSATISNITTQTLASNNTDGWLAVTAAKAADSAKASSFKINLNISTNTLTTRSIMYAVCLGNCPSSLALATPDDGSTTGASCASGVAACGAISTGTAGSQIVLLNDTSTFNVDTAVTTKTYNIYFWLDSTRIANADMGASFAGYISAEATQGE